MGTWKDALKSKEFSHTLPKMENILARFIHFKEKTVKKIICISASNIVHSCNQSTSLVLCEKIASIVRQKGIICEIIDLRDSLLSPCIGCGKCYDSKRCYHDNTFNGIYESIIQADGVFFVSPHYAPIPAKLSMLLEKMEEITFLHWWKDNTYQSEVYGIPAGIISHGGGADWALKSYIAMVNDTIANALETIQLKTVAFDSDCTTGISLGVSRVIEQSGIFPVQEYDWDSIMQKLNEYIDVMLSK